MSRTLPTSKGLRILNTRPANQNKPLSNVINEAGGYSIELPTLVIEPLDDWLRVMPPTQTISISIFISVNAVNLFFEALKKHQKSWPATIANIAVGKATANAIENNGFAVTYLPEKANSESLLQLPALQSVANQTIVQIKGKGGRSLINETLKARGARLISLPVYERLLPTYSSKVLHSLWQDNGVDIILFTSQQAIYNLFALFDNKAHAWLQRKPCLVISQRIATTARLIGMQSITVCSYDTLQETLYDLCQSKKLK